MESGFFIVILARKAQIHRDRVARFRRALAERFGAGCPGDLTLCIGGKLHGAERIGLEDVWPPRGARDFGLPEGGGAMGGVGLPAIGTDQVAGGETRLSMRVVLNTNIVISALLWRGKPYQLLEAVSRSRELRLFASLALLEEWVDVLARPMVAKRLALIGKTAAEVLADYQAVLEVIEPFAAPRVVLRDADDDQVIAAAFAAQADFIVSGDDDLLSVGRYQGISILTATQALLQIQSEDR
jgi:putative PIN family toxin of toxin-antitoxin system